MKGLILPLLAILLFSGRPASSSHFTSAVSDSTMNATDSILHDWFGKQQVKNTRPICKTFWLYLPVHELDTVESTHQFLRSFNYESAYQLKYFNSLSKPAYDKNAVALILRESERLRIRDVWPSYWATINENQYGEQLVKVELEDSSLLVSFIPGSDNPFTVYDVYGNVISLSQVIRREQHIAAVFMLYPEKTGGSKQTIWRRTFFLTNEKMIREWQHDTPAMQEGILHDLNYLLLAEAWLKEDPSHTAKSGRGGKNIISAWNNSSAKKTIQQELFSCYRTSQPFDMNASAMESAIAAIRKIWPKQVKPLDKFPSRGIR
jgi:hypothetical protein